MFVYSRLGCVERVWAVSHILSAVNTRKARPARKSRGERYPATGLMVKPVRSETVHKAMLERKEPRLNPEQSNIWWTDVFSHLWGSARRPPAAGCCLLGVTVFDEHGQVLEILAAGVCGVEFIQLPEHHPHVFTLLCELYTGNGVSTDRRANIWVDLY